MLGDIIISLKKLFRENTCIHNYEDFEEIDGRYIVTGDKCKKCGRVVNKREKENIVKPTREQATPPSKKIAIKRESGNRCYGSPP